jgi:predicted metal-dependent peptidase
MIATEKLRAATSYLILHHPFLAVPLLRLRLVPKSEEPTAATDGRAIFYNPSFIDDLSLEEAIFLLAHEVLHVALAHHLRRAGRHPKAWNAAADFVINRMLEEAGFSIIEGALLNAGFAGWSTEQVYRSIVRYAEQQLAAARASDAGSGAPGNLSGQSGQDGAAPELGEFVPEGTGGRVEDLRGDDGRDLSQAARSREEGDLAVTLKQALRADAMVRGDSGLRAAFSRTVQPVPAGFDARTELAELLSAVIGRDDYTWTRPNPRYLSSGLYLPALAGGLSLVDPIVAIDTSASITPHLLSFMAGVCEDLLAAFPETVLRVVYCDSEVRSTEEITVQDLPVTLSRAQGGGGTRFSPVFEWVEKNGYQPRFLLYLTDLAGDSPEDPGYPVVWLSVSPVFPSLGFGRRIDLSGLE